MTIWSDDVINLDSDDESSVSRARGKRPRVEVDISLRVGASNAKHASSSRQCQSVQDNDSLKVAVLMLLKLFPLLCPKVAASLLYPLLEHSELNAAVEQAANYILENGINVTSGDAFPQGASSRPCGDNGTHLYLVKDDEIQRLSSQIADAVYEQRCMERLTIGFPHVRKPDLKDALAAHGNLLGPSYKAVKAAYEESITGSLTNVSWLPLGKLNLLRKPRRTYNAIGQACPQFDSEWASLQLELDQKLEGRGQQEACPNYWCQLESQDIECGCCCCDFPFEEMIQCADGHLFCFGCLRRRVEESVFGGLQACGSLPCMDTDGCTEAFPFSEIKRALPEDILLKYEQRQAEDAIARAKLPGLVYCPFCSFPWEVDPSMPVLNCANKSCSKASCLRCKEPNHLPLRCHEVEKRSESSHRRHIEELMSKAIIRECSVCKAELVKSEGCNKITCRCGQAMCYVCRKPIAPNYDHFCQHTRVPNKCCTRCSKCGLWDKEEDEKVVNWVKQAALQAIAKEELSSYDAANRPQ